MTDPTPLPEQDTPEQDPAPLPGVTEHGWPYVTPDDHPMQYPATSQALAELLDARQIITGISHVVVDAPSGWAFIVDLPEGYRVISAHVTDVHQGWFPAAIGFGPVPGALFGLNAQPAMQGDIRWMAVKEGLTW